MEQQQEYQTRNLDANSIPDLGEELDGPITLDEETANTVAGYLGSRPWAEVNHVIDAFKTVMEAYVANYRFAQRLQEMVQKEKEG